MRRKTLGTVGLMYIALVGSTAGCVTACSSYPKSLQEDAYSHVKAAALHIVEVCPLQEGQAAPELKVTLDDELSGLLPRQMGILLMSGGDTPDNLRISLQGEYFILPSRLPKDTVLLRGVLLDSPESGRVTVYHTGITQEDVLWGVYDRNQIYKGYPVHIIDIHGEAYMRVTGHGADIDTMESSSDSES